MSRNYLLAIAAKAEASKLRLPEANDLSGEVFNLTVEASALSEIPLTVKIDAAVMKDRNEKEKKRLTIRSSKGEVKIDQSEI